MMICCWSWGGSEASKRVGGLRRGVRRLWGLRLMLGRGISLSFERGVLGVVGLCHYCWVVRIWDGAKSG